VKTLTKDFSSVCRYAIVLSGGVGERFSASVPKQFVLMKGKKLLSYSLEALEKSKEVEAVLLVAPKDFLAESKEIAIEVAAEKLIDVIEGGGTRQDSSRLAIEYLLSRGARKDALVLVLDADRPNLLERYIAENYLKASQNGASITAIPSSDSIAVSGDESTISAYLPREEAYLVQTPQGFRLSLLASAHEKARKEKKHFTDEGSLVLAYEGTSPLIVRGDKNNLKITTTEDKTNFEGGFKQ
jgi:ribitol-5-phosphate 2-dehydrogenase (NADP+) / D-ribitol-5-phosphate cytidylyltransferase